MPVGNPSFVTDLQLDFSFEVKVEDFETETGFTSVDGLDQVVGVEEYKEGGEDTFTHRLPDRVKYTNLILKRGVKASSSAVPPSSGKPKFLIEWFEDAINFYSFETKTVEVTLMGAFEDPTNSSLITTGPVKKWRFVNAWPVAWKTAQLNSHPDGGNAAILYETIEIAYQYFYRLPV